MILKNDILVFSVQNKTINQAFQTYSKALEFALTLDFAFINIRAQNVAGDSAFSASVAKVKAGQIEMIHARYAIDRAV